MILFNRTKALQLPFIGVLIVLSLILTLWSPRTFNADPTTSRNMDHHQFVAFIAAQADIANIQITQNRQQLLSLYHQFNHHRPMSAFSLLWLQNLAKDYKITNAEFTHDSTWRTLIERVDIIPESLVVAQAIEESGWGTSRFAQTANNYFGQQCYSDGCGVSPQGHDTAGFQLRKFPDALTSIQSYMNNLNSLGAYAAFREQRYDLRSGGKPLTGLALIDTITSYSERGSDYIDTIRTIISQYDLTRFDAIGLFENQYFTYL
jgi:Bax protein